MFVQKILISDRLLTVFSLHKQNPITISHTLALAIVMVQRLIFFQVDQEDSFETLFDEAEFFRSDSFHSEEISPASEEVQQRWANQSLLLFEFVPCFERFANLLLSSFGPMPLLSRLLTREPSLLTLDATDLPRFLSQYHQMPFGELRLRIIEFFIMMSRSHAREIHREMIRTEILPIAIRALFHFQWNNNLHSLVESLARTVIDAGSFALKHAVG